MKTKLANLKSYLNGNGNAIENNTSLKGNKRVFSIKKLPLLFLFQYLYLIIFLLSFPKIVVSLDEHFMEIKVNKVGFNQILSDEYNSALPSKVFINNKIQLLKNKTVYINSIEDIIRLEWNNLLNNFSFMFNNLTNVKSIYMYYMFGSVSNFSPMQNLRIFYCLVLVSAKTVPSSL